MKMALFLIHCFLAFLLNLMHPSSTFANEDKDLETYIIHVELPQDKVFATSQELEIWYHSFLSKSLPGFDTKSRMVHMYKNVIQGFAARLTPDEFLAIQEYEGFVHARPQRMLYRHTTHTPNFLGLHQGFGFWKDANYGQGIIIGVIDSGVSPDHPSFSDEGMPPPPPKWKGACEFNFTACNNKLIGARYFTFDEETPLDGDGHGTHTASTATGNFVPGANEFGLANGTAVGIAPRAHLAVYKVCPSYGSCTESSILAGMDSAIEDGVDILSVSLGLTSIPFTFDAIALGAYSAMQKGIFVSCAAGNSGPSYRTLENEAPWILTVGASTVDRKLKATLMLGNKVEIEGESIAHQPTNLSQPLLPLVYPEGVCSSSSLVKANVSGKIVVCEINATMIDDVHAAGAAGVILIHPEEDGVTKILEYIETMPAIQISYTGSLDIIAYVNSTSKPVATLSFQGTVIGDNDAPIVASFSSRGPNIQSNGILKPDVIGPGSNILAAKALPLDGEESTKSKFAIASGTSMACPHLSGVAALLKSAHPDWSPAAIKSAIMTTADVMNLAGDPIVDQTLQPADVFTTGAGHVNPSKANDPGLIYDIKPQDYILYLCGLRYTNREVAIITQQKVNCSATPNMPDSQLNYPSFSIVLGRRVQTYTRTVTNVGEAISTYVVKITALKGVEVSVKPEKLEFSELNQKLTYEVTFTKVASSGDDETSNYYSQGFLVWTWGNYAVRSPIVVAIIR